MIWCFNIPALALLLFHLLLIKTDCMIFKSIRLANISKRRGDIKEGKGLKRESWSIMS